MKIEVHRITRCGFYQRGSKNPLFGALPEWHGEFNKWVQGRSSVSLTSTFQAQDLTSPTVFCAGSTSTSDGLGLILWHGVPSTEKGVAYIQENDQPGKVNVQEASLGANSIPGWASYYWILPQLNLLVCLQPAGKIRNRGNGLPDCRGYIHGWLRQHSDYVHCISRQDSPDGADFEIVWRSSPKDVGRSDLNVHFDSHPVTMPCAFDEMRLRCDEIRKLVHSVQLSRVLPRDWDVLTRLVALLGYEEYAPPETDHLNFRWESDWRPGMNELNALIARQSEQAIVGRKERQGVRFRGDSTVYWLDGGPLRDEIEVPQSLEDALHWSPKQLAQAWGYAEERISQWGRDARN